MADVLQTLAAAPTPAEDPMGAEARKAQYRIAELLSQQGLDTSPIISPWQGLARVAQAGFGGWDRSLLDKEERAQTAAYRKLMDQDPRLSTGDAPAAPDRVAAALAGGPTVANTAATYGAGPASIRNNNPGAMWPGPSSAAYGSTGSQNVAGNNKIATFSDPVAGAAAQFDLLKRNYSGMTMADAIKKWSGGNNVDAYTAGVSKATGLLPNTMITPELLNSPQGISLARAMARHEAGRDYPLSPEQWAQAQGKVFGGGVPAAPAGVPGGAVPQSAPSMPGVAPGPAGSPPVSAADPQQAPGVPGAAPQNTAAVPGTPQAATPGTPPTQVNRVPTQMTPQIANYIRQLRATNNPAAIAQAEALTQQYSKPTEYDFKTFGDKIARTDKLGNMTIVGDANKKPNAIEEAEYAASNWQKLGFPDPQSTDPKAQQFWRQLNANRLSGISTMIDQRAPDAFETHYGEGMAKQALATIDAGNTASLQGQKIQLAQRMLQDIQTGKLTPTTSTVGGWMQAFGVDPARFGINPSTPMTAEALTGLTNDMVIGKIGAGGMPSNNFSDADRKFLEKTSTSLSDRPEANFLKLELARRVNDLQAQKANAWADARDGGLSYEKFERQWRKDTQGKDIFGDLIEQAKAFGAQPSQQGGPIDQPKFREGVQSVVGSEQYKAAVEAAKKRGWTIPGVTQ